MQYRLGLAARVSAAVLLLAFVSACGGGGSSSPSTPATPVPVGPTTAPAVTATPAPGTLSVPGLQSSGGGGGGFVNDGKTPSTYAVTSIPSGLAFTVAGQSYTTPKTISPAATTNALSIVFTASGYTVPIVQVYDGAHTVFYNSAADSKGTIALTSLQAIRRSSAAASSPQRNVAAVLHRSMHGRKITASDIDPTRLAVRLSAAALRTSGRSAAAVERAAGAVGHATLSATTDELRVVSVPAGVDIATFTRKLQAQPEVAEVTAVHRRRTLARAPTTVSDPAFQIPDQWDTFATGANYAWSYNPGTGAKLAIIDTGIDDNNTDLSGQLAFQETAVTPIDNTPTAANGGVPTCDSVAGATTVVTPNTAQDDDGHGTNVASIAIAKANTAGFAGAAWGAALLAFKVFPSQNQYCNDNSANFGAGTPDEAQAIADAIAQGADVISLSLGSSSVDTVEFNAIQNAIAAGVTVVAAAGNSDDGSGAGTLDYPSAYPSVISVGASALKDEFYTAQQPQTNGTYTTSTEIVATYSQYGPSLSVVAPGGEASACAGSVCDDDVLHWIENYSTSTAYLAVDQCFTPSPATSCVALFNGTSMATPQVAATAAMLIAEAGGHKHLTPAQVNYAIESTADNINDPHQGHGRLNAYRALASLIRDTSAYSGPIPQKAGTGQLIAFAYAASRTNKPKILDATFPAGVPVNADGTFRIADVPAATGAFSVAVWYDANGDGVVDAGDQIGVGGVKCSSTAVCAIGSITLKTATAGYFLP
jgi:hypothetical protein